MTLLGMPSWPPPETVERNNESLAINFAIGHGRDTSE